MKPRAEGKWLADELLTRFDLVEAAGRAMGTEIGNSWIIALAWCVGIGIAGFLWSRSIFARRGRDLSATSSQRNSPPAGRCRVARRR
ncbi:hypothetical protein [Nocardia asteroides]|uniref:hypothetical protein n=1 Tax=Nocardia asteroides TaxID=1824 RepID=UPI001E340038|nr:hypothetical protein [Nocardia asteroides]UGT59144.1 hypothetical protein LTT61_17790 [Nocardia asteroides]